MMNHFQDAVKVMAKDLVRTRRYTKKFIMMRAQIQAVSLKITTLKSQNAMAQAMKGVTKAMMNMNKLVHIPYFSNSSYCSFYSEVVSLYLIFIGMNISLSRYCICVFIDMILNIVVFFLCVCSASCMIQIR